MPGTSTQEVAVESVRQLVGPDAEVGSPVKLAGGAIHDSWAVDANTKGEPLELVVRVTPAGRLDHDKTLREYAILKATWELGAKVPQPLSVGIVPGGEDYLVMTRMPGDTNPREVVAGERFAAMREHVIHELAQQLALVHTLKPSDLDAPGIAGPAEGEDPLAYERRELETRYRASMLNPHPAMEWAFRWLDRQIERLHEPGREVCVVHGDFRIGNIMFDEQGLTAVLDWEGMHIGEPEEELAWFCTKVWRFGQDHLEAGGMATREAWARAYEEASGRTIGRERLAAWEVLQNLRWAEITMMQARAHLDGDNRSHELAAIGRRTAETELEVLRLTGVEEMALAG